MANSRLPVLSRFLLAGLVVASCGDPTSSSGLPDDTVVPPGHADGPGDVGAAPTPAAGGSIDPSTPVGTLAGELTVTNSGTAHYSVPLKVAPGRAGMQPQLALTYDSSRAAGLVGHGWAISGLSRVHRCAPNPAHEGALGPVRFDTNDPLCLDGTRLILATEEGDYGKPGAEYFPEGSVSARVVQDSEGFVVYSANARTSRYGGTLESVTPGPDGQSTRSWLLREVCDLDENCIDYEYDFNFANYLEARIAAIHYTRSPTQAAVRRVEFGYAPRDIPDRIEAWWYGAESRIRHKLIHVHAYGPDNQLVRRYELGHTDDLIGFEGEQSARLLVDGLRECDGAGVCKPPTRFEYTHGQSPSTVETAWNGHPYSLAASNEAHALDADGDGFQDLLVRGATDYELFWARGAGSGGTFEPQDLGLESPDGTRAAVGDFNGNGCDGFILKQPDGIRLFESDCNGFIDEGMIIHGEAGEGNAVIDVAIADFDGDGRQDIMYCQLETGGEETCVPTEAPDDSPAPEDDFPVEEGEEPEDPDGPSTVCSASTANWAMHSASGPIDTQVTCAAGCYYGGECSLRSAWLTLDVTHDGAANLLQVGPDETAPHGASYTAFEWDEFGEPIEHHSVLPVDYFQRLNTSAWGRGKDKIVDVNGDGHPDIVRFEPDAGDFGSPGSDDHFYNACDGTSEPFTGASARVYINRGHGKPFQYDGALVDYEEGWDQLCTEFLPSLPGDWDGDGRTDLVFPKTEEGEDYGELWVSLSRYPAPAETKSTTITFVDVNRPMVPIDAAGRGVFGLTMVTDSGSWRIAQRSGTDGLLESVTDGYGAVATVEYLPGTDDDVYTESDACQPSEWGTPWWHAPCRTTARPLVSRVERETSISTAPLASTYHYTDARSHRERRASLGFGSRRETRWVETWPTSTTLQRFDLETYDEDRHLFPRARKPVEVTTHTLLSPDNRQHIVRELIDYEEISASNGAVVTRRSYSEHVEADSDQLCNPSSLTGCLEPEQATQISYRERAVTKFDDDGNGLVTVLNEGDAVESTVTLTYANTEGPHPMALPETVVTVSQGETGPSEQRSVHYDYYDGTHQLQRVTTEPDHPTLESAVDFKYDSEGNVTSVTTTGRDGTGGWIAPRVSELEFEYADHVLPTAEVNALGHRVEYEYDQGLGVVTLAVDPNEVATHYRYDGFGRETASWTTAGVDGPAEDSQTTTSYARLEAVGVVDQPSPIAITSETVGGASVTVEHDRFGREVRRQWKGLAGKEVYQSTWYDPLARSVSESTPTDVGEELNGWSTSIYDELGRTLEISLPGTQPTKFRYQARTTFITDPRDNVSVQENDPQGRPKRRTDPYGTSVCFFYGAFGSLEETHVNTTGVCGATPPEDIPPASKDAYVIRTGTNAYGWKTEVADPSLGLRLFRHNALGELVRVQTDLDTIELTRDPLGRTVARKDADGETIWEFDEGTTGGLAGLPRFQRSADGVETSFKYDEFARLVAETVQVGEEKLTTGYGYDARGHVERIDYPGPHDISVYYATDDYGNVFHVDFEPFQWPPQSAVWMLAETDASGYPSHTFFGNGLATTRGYDHQRLVSIATGPAGAATADVQHLQYDYDDAGNLDFRDDLLGFNHEEFEYDDVNRVVKSSRWFDPSQPEVEDIVYGPLGAILYRTGIGDYKYESTSAVTGVTYVDGSHFKYDDLGRQIQRDGAEISYAANQRIRGIKGVNSGAEIEALFEYDADFQLVRQTVNGNETTTIGGGLYQRSRTKSGKVTDDYYIRGPVGVVARLSFGPEATVGTMHYHHTDHLGSTDVITDEDGKVEQRQSYDLFGAPRNAETWSDPASYENKANWEHGYTGHKEELVAGLTNMRGRMYDARIGRFAAPDPLVGGSASSQSFDRYSYVRNRPLNLVDPSGFCAEQGNHTSDDGVRHLCVDLDTYDPWDDYSPRGAVSVNFDWSEAGGYAATFVSTLDDIGRESILHGLKGVAFGATATFATPVAMGWAQYEGVQALVHTWKAFAADPASAALAMTPVPEATSAKEAYDAGDMHGAIAYGTRAVGKGIQAVIGLSGAARAGIGWALGRRAGGGLARGANGRASFEGMEVRGMRDLSHVPESTLRAQSRLGFASKDHKGRSLALHHHQQNPAGPIIEIPRVKHSTGNPKQHPFGNAKGKGLTPQERADFNAWRTNYWKARAQGELTRRGL